MKQTIRKWLCGALAGALCMTAAGAAASTDELTPAGARAYLNAITQLQQKYGTAASAQVGIGDDRMWEGLALAQLVDFDGDGTPELYCGSVSGQHLYTYDGGLVDLAIPEQTSNFSSDVSPTTLLCIGADKAYLVDGHNVMNGGEVRYLTKDGSQMIAALTYTDEIGQYPDGSWGADICTLNGQQATLEQVQAAVSALTADMDIREYTYWNNTWAAGLNVGGTVQQTITALRTLTNPTAKVSAHKVTIDGKAVALGAYEINGNNYFKLRDLAQTLSGTDAQFEVAWNGAAQRIDLTDGEPYTSVGGELAGLPSGSRAAALTTATVYLGGEALDLTAYEIDGNNYFKLRDLGEALDFGVTWQPSTQTVVIDTDASYTE